MKRYFLMSLFLLILLSGNSWSNSFSQRSELNSTRETTSSVPIVKKDVDSKTYTNDKFGFAIKLADDLGLLEQKPDPSDSFLTKVYIPHNRGSFASEVLVYKNKNTTPLITHNLIHEIFNNWYGYPEGTQLPFQNANEEQYFINGTPAIKLDYLEHSEDPSIISPASVVFTANEFFVYRITCCCDRGRCNEIIRSFALVGIDWGKHVVKEEHFDSPSLVKLKVLQPTAATISGQKVTGWFLIRNVGPSYSLDPKIGPHYEVRVYDLQKNLLSRTIGGWPSRAMKSGDEIKIQWGTTVNQDGEAQELRSLVLSPGIYELQVDLLFLGDQILDAASYYFDVKRVD